MKKEQNRSEIVFAILFCLFLITLGFLKSIFFALGAGFLLMILGAFLIRNFPNPLRIRLMVGFVSLVLLFMTVGIEGGIAPVLSLLKFQEPKIEITSNNFILSILYLWLVLKSLDSLFDYFIESKSKT